MYIYIYIYIYINILIKYTTICMLYDNTIIQLVNLILYLIFK